MTLISMTDSLKMGSYTFEEKSPGLYVTENDPCHGALGFHQAKYTT